MKKATGKGRGGPAPALSGIEGCPPVRWADTQIGPYTCPTIDNRKSKPMLSQVEISKIVDRRLLATSIRSC